MRTIEIEYSYGKSIVIEVPRKRRNENSLPDCLITGSYKVFDVKVVDGLAEFVSHVVSIANDSSSNSGAWYAHCNGYCLGAIVNHRSKSTGMITINSFREYRKSKIGK